MLGNLLTEVGKLTYAFLQGQYERNSSFNNLGMACSVANDPSNATVDSGSKCLKDVKPFNETCLAPYRDSGNASYASYEENADFSFDVDCLLAKECLCVYDNHIASTVFDLSPYLYPFSIEYSILVGMVSKL